MLVSPELVSVLLVCEEELPPDGFVYDEVEPPPPDPLEPPVYQSFCSMPNCSIYSSGVISS